MNKGVRLATGDVIGFVHADDFLAHPDVLSKVVAEYERSGCDGVYGDLTYVRETKFDTGYLKLETGRENTQKNAGKLPALPGTTSGTRHSTPDTRFRTVRYWKSGEYDLRSLRYGWMPPHPTLFLKREVYEKARLENGEYFDTSFKIAAVYDFMLRILHTHKISVSYLPEVLVNMRMGGTSNRSLGNIILKSREDLRAMRRNGVGGVWTLLAKNLRKLPQFFRKAAKRGKFNH